MTPVGGDSASRGLLAVAAVAVGFAAADTYVVVLALPDMMSSVGLSIDELQRGAPVVSGFLLGYIAMLPLIGRIADIRGRIPVLVWSLVAFAVGSLVTAGSYDLVSMVIGRFLQGAGGGGLVPATLALVADLWSAERRGLPLGAVSAVQELGAVVGPLYGAAVLALTSWHAIFWINLAVGLVLASLLLVLSRRSRPRRQPDLIGLALGVLALLTLALVLVEPERLTTGLTTGRAFIRHVGDSRWSTPVAFTFFVLVALLCVREATARRPLVDWQAWRTIGRHADLPGALLLGGCLAGVVLAFATADPRVQVFSPAGVWFLASSGLLAIAFGWRQRRSSQPLVPTGALRANPAWGAILVSFFVGAALVAALVDIPIFARATVYPDSQLDAALVLVRLLVAVPVGALLGGYLIRRSPAALTAAGGMLAVAAGLGQMTTWHLHTLDSWVPTTVPLVLAGLGFGLVLAPTNAAVLAATSSDVHGLASALLVVSRMVGMLVGLSALTTIGLRRFYAVSAQQPPLRQVCPSGRLCDAYERLLENAAVQQLHAVFWGATGCAVIAAILSFALLRVPKPLRQGRPRPSVPAAPPS